MPNRDRVPEYQGMLHRPRVHSLIQEGLQHSLLVVLAGPGYGKTQSVASYLKKTDAKVLWLRLNSLDNLRVHFWDRLLRALQNEFPDIAVELEAIEFPDTPTKFDIFTHILTRGFARYKQVIWVLDDFGEITNHEIKDFLRILAEMELDELRLVLISNALTSTESVAFMTSKRFLILGKDLRLTPDEIVELYAMHGISLDSSELTDIERYTEGWPLPLHLLVLHHDALGDTASYDGRLTHHTISHLFEERFFAAYPQEQQKLFIKLALLTSFTWEIVVDLYEGNRLDLDMLTSHVFITNEPITGQLVFHQLYRNFLERKKHLLTTQEEHAFWQKAADYHAASGHTNEAIACYRRCEDYVGMLNVMIDYAKTQYGITGTNAAYILEHLDLLPPELLLEHPEADYLRALIYVNTLKLDKAEKIMLDLEQRLLDNGTPEALTLLGDIYGLLGSLHMMRNQEDFGDYYKKAADLLPNGTNFKTKNKLHNNNHHNFSISDNASGAKERMVGAVHYGVPWMAKVLDGGMSGMEHLFSSEASYLSYELEDAKQHAYRAIFKAEPHAQHDLICNAYIILARIAFLQGDFAEMSAQIQTVVEYAEKYNIGTIKEIRDTALGWYYVKLHDYKRVPKSILAVNSLDWPILAYGRTQIVYANYLLNIGEYAKMIGMLENPQGLFLTNGIWPDRICLFILLAIGYHHLGNPQAAVQALWTAYDMTYNNGLITLFVEAEDHMRILTDLARQQHDHKFDPAWLDLVSKQASSFAKRASAVRVAYKKQNPQTTAISNPLTRREMETLQALARGLTREEIATEQFVSVNTVKTFIRSIYNKLNAANRAEAVSIAISRGYIDVFMPE